MGIDGEPRQDRLESILYSVTEPWLCIGDLNQILNESEMAGGAIHNRGLILHFKSLHSKLGLYDMGFKGHEFTWHREHLYERLDRALCNSSWQHLFPHATLHHLPFIPMTDHCHVFLVWRSQTCHQQRAPSW